MKGMKRRMKPIRKRILSGAMALIMTATLFVGTSFSVFAGDTLPMLGDEARKAEQPKFSGYRIWDMRDWSPETDPYAEFLRAEIPLQSRIEAFKPTQANPTLDSDAQIMLMQGDYGNAFVDGMPYNNTFLYHTLNFWQYTDYYSPWHGAITAKVPENLWDWEGSITDSNAWMKREFEFGILNIPNPAYTNAAHKNGVMSIACIYFDQAFREGQTVDELLIQDEDGGFIIVDKLIEMAEYFGYDGYFFNCEEAPYSYDVLKQWLYQLEEAGLYTQYYNTNSTFDASKAEWLYSDINGDGVKEKIQDSVFVNYGSFSNVDSQIQFALENGYDPFEQVFFGVEANQGGFGGGHTSVSNLPNLYASGTKNPRGSIALFTPSDMYHRGVDEVKGGNPVSTADPDYMWMVAERERMYFSGVMEDPTDTGKKPGYSRNDVGVSNAGGWVGVADFTSERSVIDGSVFYSNFNTGKGRSYWTNGVLTNEDDWTNITVQDILPTWQWWVEVPEAAEGEEAYGKLGVDFDYGERYYTGALDYTHIGAYNGGSSLVVAGDLEAENLVRLYKTELDVTAASKMQITYQKPSASDSSEMKLALIFKDAPEAVEYIAIPETGTKTTSWKTATVDLSKYAGRQIATIGLAFAPKQQIPVENYQMNIGEIRLTDGSTHTPTQPTGFAVSKAYATDDMVATWNLDSFDVVDKYEIYATLSNGKKVMVGTNYDSIHYIKSLENEKNSVKLELVAIGKDGSRSTAAVTTYNYSEKISNLKADTETASTGNGVFTKRAGIIDLTWTNPSVDYASIEFTVTLDDSTDDTVVTKSVEEGVTATAIVLPRGNGEKYQVAARTVYADGTKSEPIMITGYMKDVWSQSYEAEKVQVSGNYIELWQPDSEDWWHLYAYFNGEQLNFSGRFQTRDHVVRGHNKMYNTLSSDSGLLTIVLEDYCGNLSEPMNLMLGDTSAEITAEMIPDDVLRAKIIEIVGGNTIGNLMAYEGALDLSNLGITNLKGLELVTGATSVDLSGNTEITAIQPGTFSSMTNLSALNISGMSGLKILDISNTSVEKIICDDPEALTSIVSADVSGCRLDLTEGTPEREFVNAVAAMTAEKEDIIEAAPDVTNIASMAAIVEDETTLTNCTRLFDGSMSYFTLGGVPGKMVIAFDSPQDIESWTFYNDSFAGYGLADFEIQYSLSLDEEDWTTLGTPVTGCSDREITQSMATPVTAKYIKLIATSAQSRGADVREFCIYAKEKIVYPAGITYDGQKPVLYPTFPDTVYYEELSDETVDPASLVSFETIRGTSAAELKDADFLAEGYDIEAQTGTIAHMTLVNGDPDTVISLAQNAVYTVTYTDFNEANPNGERKGTIVVKVGEQEPEPDKSALEALIETAEGIKRDEFTEDTVEVLEKALADAKAVLADGNATQEEIDAAYGALEAALNGLVEKGETSVTPPADTGDYTNMTLPIILIVVFIAAAAVGCAVYFVRRHKASK